MKNMACFLCIFVFVIGILTSFIDNAQAHKDHYSPRLLAKKVETQEESNVSVARTTVADAPVATNYDRQLAFFECEMLMHLALRSPTPIQQEIIDLGYADHRLVTNMPGGPKLQDLKDHRAKVQKKLRENYAVCRVIWTDNTVSFENDLPVSLAQGLSRHVLLEIVNQTAGVLDITGRQANDDDAPTTGYTIHPGPNQFIPIEIVAESADDIQLEIELKSVRSPSFSHKLKLPVEVTEPAIVCGKIFDDDSSETWPGRLYVLGSDQEYRHGEAYAVNETLSTKQLLQFWNLGRYYKLPFFYSDGTFEVKVPAGKTSITLERGFEHEVVETEIVLKPGEIRDISLNSSRLVDMKKQGWISGDTHVHWVTNQWNVDMPLDLLATVQRAEDLQVANNLTLLQRGPSLAFINPAQAPMGTVEEFSNESFHIEMGEEYRNEDLYGHLCFLNLDWLVLPIGTGSIIAGPDALDYPINKTAILSCREQGGISCEAHGLGGNKDVPVNVVHKLTDSLDQIAPKDYYDFLDCGFHLPLTNGSDHPARVLGCARAYVKVDGEFTYDKWIDGIRNCRTFTTSGPVVFLTVNGKDIGETLDVSVDETLEIRAKVVSRYPIGHFQIISNGELLQEEHVAETEAEILLEIPAGESRWIVARASPTDNYNAIEQGNVAHTSAIYVNVDGKPRFVESKAKRWISEMRKHIRDIRGKGRFSNDLQMNEAIQYVEDGISLFQEMIDNNQGSFVQVATTNEQATSINTGKSPWPTIENVDAQPLLVQTKRLEEALDYIGNPLSDEIKSELAKLKDESDPAKVVAEIEKLLDPLCLAAVDIDSGKISAVTSSEKHEILERGWRSYLVKVCNRNGITSRLKIESPNARSMPHAKQEDVASRWLGLSMFDGRPLQPNLSGLELEYRIVQLYSRDVGELNGTLEFAIDSKGGKRGRQIREWRFDEDADGWDAANDSEIEVKDGSLHVTSTGLDPYIRAAVGDASGDLILRFWAETEDDGVIQVFWWSEEHPFADENRMAMIPIIPGGAQQYEVTFSVDGVLQGVRIDPNIKPSKTRIDWIDLSFARRRGETWTSVPVNFVAKPAIPIDLEILDKPGEPAVASIEIRDHLGRVYPEQTKRLAPDFFFHPQIYRKDGETINLPPGEYQVTCKRGPHSLPELRNLIVDESPSTLSYKVERWVDPTEYGWWSGDHHIHSAGCLHYLNPTEGVLPSDMIRHTMGEDMNVGCCLTWGPCFDYQKQFFTGQVDKASEYPYLIRYDVEVSGFGSHASGHLNLLRLKEQIYPGGDSKHHWPTLGLNTLRWAKQQDAICGPAHSGNGLTNYVGRLGEHEDGPHGLPHFNIPAFDGIGACEYIVDVTHEVPGPDGRLVPAIDFISAMDTPRKDEWNMWYHTLNCGFRTRVSGETDFPCMSGERVGIGRVYVKVDGKLNFDDWIQGIQDGKSYVSDGFGHIIDFQTRVIGENRDFLPIGELGSEIRLPKPGKVEFQAKCAVRAGEPGENVTVELIVNGYPAETKEIPADGSMQDVHFKSTIDESSWVAMRVYPHVHTNPFFVVVDDQPIRASQASAEWCLRCVEQCWLEKQATYALEEQQDAREAYQHAKDVYKKIRDECKE